VNDEAYSGEVLKAAIKAAKGSNEPIRLIVKNGNRFRTVTIDYRGGPRYPKLEKIGTSENGLDRLLTPR
jgi:hypothetical protein